ncbi:MAG: hypothetical protein MI923_25820 [Phycisphaerales bacterium]|nr:hypothetical protein [Phycisphaerales bacterium]
MSPSVYQERQERCSLLTAVRLAESEEVAHGDNHLYSLAPKPTPLTPHIP